MSFGIRSRRYDPHVYMCRACGTWNLVLFPHGRADHLHEVTIPEAYSRIPHADAWHHNGPAHQVITCRVPQPAGQLAVYLTVDGVRQAFNTPLRNTTTSAVMSDGRHRPSGKPRSWTMRSWSEERGDPCVMVCGNAITSTAHGGQVQWCLRTAFCRGWPLADIEPLDHPALQASYHLDGEVGVQVALSGMLREAKKVPRYFDRRVLVPMWDKIHTDDEQ